MKLFQDLTGLFSRRAAVLYILIGFSFYITTLVISRQIINRGYLSYPYIGKFPLLIFGSFTGFQSGITGLCLKSTVELVKTQITGSPNFEDNPTAYLLPLSAIISVFLHILLLNAGLKYYDALQMVPVVQSSLIIYNIMTGGIVLNEFSTFNRKASICFPLGIAMCTIGILVLLLKKDSNVTKQKESNNNRKITQKQDLEQSLTDISESQMTQKIKEYSSSTQNNL